MSKRVRLALSNGTQRVDEGDDGPQPSTPRAQDQPSAAGSPVDTGAGAQPPAAPPAPDRPPSFTSLDCAAHFTDGTYHGGRAGEGRYATTSARRGAMRRGASSEELNGVAWTGWTDQPRSDAHAMPFRRVSPLRPAALERELRQHPNRAFARQVVKMVREGVSLGADAYVSTGLRLQPNLPSAAAFPGHIRKWIGKELAAGRVAGPFTEMPHPNLQCWGVGVIPKNNSDLSDPDAPARVITNLSQEADGLPSVNATVSREDARVHYTKVIDAVDTAELFREQGGDPHCALADLKSAYRNLQVRREDLSLTGFRLPNAVTGVVEFYVDLCVGFGGRASPSRFDTFACAVQWTAEQRVARQGIRCRCLHCLDDYICVGFDAQATAKGFDMLLDLFDELGIPAEPAKTQPPSRRAQHLGIIMDLAARALSLPTDTAKRWRAELLALAAGSPASPKAIAAIAGKLGFGMACMPAMRQRMAPFYAYASPALRDGRGRNIRHTNGELRSAAAAFARVLATDPVAPFGAFSASPENAELQLAVDAAGHEGLGGFAFDSSGKASLYHATWPEGFTQGLAGVSSGLQELLTVVAVVCQLPHSGAHLNFWSDSGVCVDAIARGWSPAPAINRTLHYLFESCATRSLTVTVAWHSRDSSPAATAADALSRGLFQEAQGLLPAIAGGSTITLRLSDCPAFAIKPSSSTMPR